MSENTFKLEDLDAAIEKEFAPLRLQAGEEEFVLRSLMRIDRKSRKAVIEKLKSLVEDQDNIDEDEALEHARFILKSVVEDGKAAKLIKALGDDVLRYTKVLTLWVEATQPGEATDSPS